MTSNHPSPEPVEPGGSAGGSAVKLPVAGVSRRGTLVVLLVTTAILLLGSGLFGTLLGVRASLEEIPTTMVGLIMSAYFVGFIVGTHLCVRIAAQVGHIRAFATFAAVVTAMALAHSIWVAVLPWMVFRFISGIALAGLALLIESWLNAQARAENRGRTFAVYMVVNLSAVAFGQLLLTAADPATFILFAVTAMLFALSLIPTSLLRVQAPVLHEPTGLSAADLARRSPVGVAGCLAAGIVGGAFWGMTPVYLTDIGHPGSMVATFMFVTIVGGMLSQLPIGRYSDGRDRRRVIFVVAILSAIAATLVMLGSFAPFGALAAAGFLFGAFMFPIYGLSVARAHDLLTPEQAMEATRGLLLIFGIGASFGPFTAGLVMSALGAWALFGWIAVIFAVLALYSRHRLRFSEAIPADAQSHFVPAALVSTQEMLELSEARAYPEPEREPEPEPEPEREHEQGRVPDQRQNQNRDDHQPPDSDPTRL